ncbi:Peroxin-3 [Fennellomyces sp. T-0311]|nr:Peroxin-3 [Fennellomyces sp. T-0311]
MPFLQSVKDYTKRHRKGLFITAAIGGGSYLLGRYATSKLRDLQEKAMTERVAKENLKRRFQQNQNDCVFTVLSLLPTLGDQILYEMNIEAAWAKLQESRKLEKKEELLKREQAAAAAEKAEKEETQGEQAQNENQEDKPNSTTEEKPELENSVGSLGASTASLEETKSKILDGILDKKAKYLLWEEIKASSFTRTFTSIYSVTLLTLLTHIQLNLLGRFTYVWSVSVLNRPEPTIRLQHDNEEPEGGFLDPQTERMFLSASWWLLHRGWRKCAERVKEAVDEVIGDVPLKRIFKYNDAEEIVNKLRRRIEYEKDGTTPISYRSWMLPDTEEEANEFLVQAGFEEGFPKSVDPSSISLKRLLDETKDYIDSPDFSAVLGSCLDEVFAIFDHHAFAKALLPATATMDFSTHRIQEIHDDEPIDKVKKVTLANLLPSISRQAHLVIAGNEYLNAFAYIKELQAFSAMIYTQYGDEITRS